MQIHRIPPLSGDYALSDVPRLSLVAPVGAAQVGLCRFGQGMRSPDQGLRASAAHELGYVVRGRLRIDTAQASYEVQAGDMLVTSPAEPHSTTALEDSEVFFVLLDPK